VIDRQNAWKKSGQEKNMKDLCRSLALSFAMAMLVVVRGDAADDDVPRPVPVTRPAMKQLIEDVKVRTPRIPLPELTDEERAELGEQADSYESRLRFHYLQGINDGRGGSRTGSGRRRDDDPSMTLDNGFKVELFWIVSRANNCQYCIGHQESKLLAAGRSEDRIAALDLDWSLFTPAERAAYAFARKFSFEPHLLSDADIEGLRDYYTDSQILEMILSMAGNNSINRWKEAVAVPQRPDEGGYSRVALEDGQTTDDRPRGTYLTSTSPANQERVSVVAPLVIDESTGQPTTATVSRRPPLESWEEVERLLASAKERSTRLPLVEDAKAREIVGEAWKDSEPLPNWVRLLANFPRTGVSRIVSFKSSSEKGDLSPLLKAQLSWIIARQDRAWYAAGDALRRLREQGQSDEQIERLDGDWKEFTPRERALFTTARNLAASPVVLTDADVAEAVAAAGPRDVVQTISYTTNCASFNRITEAAGLPIEP
jgi:alkylhydroperoxidase family enzyme